MNRKIPGRQARLSSARNISAFTLVEVLVALFITAVAIVGLTASLASLSRAEQSVVAKDELSLLAIEKLEELISTQDYRSTAGGSFTDPRYENYSWTVEELQTGIETVTMIRVTVTAPRNLTATAERLIYDFPETEGAI